MKYKTFIVLVINVTFVLASIVTCAQSSIDNYVKTNKLSTIADSVLKSIECQDPLLLGNTKFLDQTTTDRKIYEAHDGFSMFILGLSVFRVKALKTKSGLEAGVFYLISKTGRRSILTVYNQSRDTIIYTSTYVDVLEEREE